MIRKFISRVLGRKTPGHAGDPSVVPHSKHGIRRDGISNGSRRTVETLQESGYQAYVVGGAVRDLLAGIKPKDFDVATDATPEQVRQCFRRSRIIGRRFQIVHVMMGQETIEVTTFRGHHGQQDSHRAHTDDQGRVLRDNVFGSQKEDAARRDFTVNALYYDPVAETVVDYHQGLADLKQRTLRMIGDPFTRYREDPVRMLRAVRLAELDFTIESATRRPIGGLAELVGNIPPSRLFDEMLKLLTSGQAVKCVQQLRAEGLHHGLLPMLDVILDQPLGERFVMLALDNTDRRVREGKPISPGFLFATLLWHEVLAKWAALKAGGERPIPALFQAMDEVLDVQAEKLAITRRIAGDIKDIWSVQPRFEQRSGKRPYALLEQPRFKASLDFLLLRAESGEVDAELGEWWSDFLDADGETRAAMLLPQKPDERNAGGASASLNRPRKRKQSNSPAAMPLAFVALGANLADPVVQVRAALEALTQLPESRLLRASSLYRTAPVGIHGQPDFINAVAALETSLAPQALLTALFAIEAQFGRRRDYRHAPRTLDLDLLLYESKTFDTPELQLPHPRMHLRAFVLAPLVEIAPDCTIPGRGSAAAWLPAVSMQHIEKIAA